MSSSSRRGIWSKLRSGGRNKSLDDPASGGSGASGTALLPSDAWTGVEMPSATSDGPYPSPPLSPDASGDSFLKKVRGGSASQGRYASLDDGRATRLEATQHNVFIMHKGWKEDTEVVNSIAEQLHTSPMRINCITMATSSSSGTVVMAAHPRDSSIPDQTASHPSVVDCFTRCPGIEQQSPAAAHRGSTSHVPNGTGALHSMMGVSGGIRGSQTPPVLRAASSSKADSPARAKSLNKRRGQRYKAAAAAFDSDAKVMVDRFNAAKVLVVLYDRQCLSILPEPLVALACVQNKFIVPVSFMGQQGLLTQISEKAIYAFSTSKFFFVDRATREVNFSNIVSHIISCMTPCAGNPLSLPAPESFLAATAATSNDVPTAQLIDLSPMHSLDAIDAVPQQQPPASLPIPSTVDDLLVLARMSHPKHQSSAMSMSYPGATSALDEYGQFDTASAISSGGDRNSALAVHLDDETTGLAMWCELFADNPAEASPVQLETALRTFCDEPMSKLHRRDKDRDDCARQLGVTCIGEATSLTRDDFVTTVQLELTGGAGPVLEKAMETQEDGEQRLETLLWLILARLTAERIGVRGTSVMGH